MVIASLRLPARHASTIVVPSMLGATARDEREAAGASHARPRREWMNRSAEVYLQ